MKLYRKGEKGQAVCEDCAKLVSTTFDYRDVPFEDGVGEAKGILAAVCDECDRVVATPPQSTPAIRRAREVATRPVEINIPAPYVEILDLALYRINARATAEHRKVLLTYFVNKVAGHSNPKAVVQGLLTRSKAFSASLGRVPRRRLSFKVTPRSHALITDLADAASASRTDLLSGLIMQIEADLVRPDKPKGIAGVEAAMAAAYA